MSEQITSLELESPEARLEYYQPLIEQALAETAQAAEELNQARERGEEVDGGSVFDARSKLYELAMEMCGYDARNGDLLAMGEHIQPQEGEIGVDLSAGTGFLTRALEHWTHTTTYGVDPSQVQLSYLEQNCGEEVVPINAAPNETEKLFAEGKIPAEGVDFATSFGGIHHIDKDSYPQAFQNIGIMLKPGGRFNAADVCGDTILSRHFDEVVDKKCLTNHPMGLWMTPDRIQEYTALAGLELISAEMKPLTWDFNSTKEMAWFFKGLHAYPQPEEEIIADLRDTLGFKEEDGKIKLNWPMLFWEIRKPL